MTKVTELTGHQVLSVFVLVVNYSHLLAGPRSLHGTKPGWNHDRVGSCRRDAALLDHQRAGQEDSGPEEALGSAVLWSHQISQERELSGRVVRELDLWFHVLIRLLLDLVSFFLSVL